MSNLNKLVDDLGALHAAIAELRIKADHVKSRLIEAGVGEYEGEIFRAVVSEAEKSWLDGVAREEALRRAEFSPQYIAAHTKQQTVTSVRVTARQTTQRRAAA